MQETLIKKGLKRKGREIVARTRGSSHGPITRLVSPSDEGLPRIRDSYVIGGNRGPRAGVRRGRHP